MRRSLFLAVAGAAWFGAATASADPAKGEDRLRAAARETATEGDHQFGAGRCDKAIALWKKAEATFHAPTILLRIARCEALLGHVVEAKATLEVIADEAIADDAPRPFHEAQAEARRDLPGVRARVAHVALEIRVRARPGVKVSPIVEIDQVRGAAGQSSFDVNPGDHVVRVRTEKAFWERRVHLDDGGHERFEVALWADEPPPAPRTQRNIGLAVGSIGLAGVLVGAGFGVSALVTSSRLDDVCGPDRKSCPAAEQGALGRVKAHSTAANVAIGGGAALLGTGVILVALESRPRRPSLEVQIVGSAGGASIRGAF